MQQGLQQSVMGERWWARKKARLAYGKEQAREKKARIKRKKENMLEAMRQEQIKKQMGTWKYYFMPGKRAEIEESFPPITLESFDVDDKAKLKGKP